MLLQMTLFYSYFWLSNIPLYVCVLVISMSSLENLDLSPIFLIGLFGGLIFFFHIELQGAVVYFGE